MRHPVTLRIVSSFATIFVQWAEIYWALISVFWKVIPGIRRVTELSLQNAWACHRWRLAVLCIELFVVAAQFVALKDVKCLCQNSEISVFSTQCQWAATLWIGLGSILNQSKYCLWWIKWQFDTFFYEQFRFSPNPVAERSNARVCGRSLPSIADSLSPGGMVACCEYCVFSGRGLWGGSIPRPEESYRLCVCVCVSLSVNRCNNNLYTHSEQGGESGLKISG
jgi:hypothetical protein